jgi:FAD/FMN-containing dehydrogenase/Fe-S oxidoreductase
VSATFRFSDYRARALATAELDAVELERELKTSVAGEVRFDRGTRGMYSTGGANYRQVPIGVVIPRDVGDVSETIRVCRSFGAPILARGGGTSLAGQVENVAVVIDFSKYMHRVVDLNPDKRLARVEPGAYLDALNKRAGKHGLMFAPDPATHTHCTLGGMVGNNSCGIHSVLGGRTADNVDELEIITYDGLRMHVGQTSEQEIDSIVAQGGRRGEIYRALRDLRDRYADLIRARFPNMPRRVSGYNLDELLPEQGFNIGRALVGTEGTCAVTLEATLHLVPSPPARSLLVLGYPSVFEAADHIMEVMEHTPIGLEGIDDGLVDNMKKKQMHVDALRYLPEGKGWLLIEFGGETPHQSHERAELLMNELEKRSDAPTMRLYDDPEEEKKVWEVRESGLGATAFVPGEPVMCEGWEDSAVPPGRFADYLRDLRRLFERFDYQGAFYGHFGDGCLHTRINFDLRTKEGIAKYRAFVEEAADLVVSYGGSLSGEHGDGESRSELLIKMFGPELIDAFREFKSIWDPQGRMNPGKIVDPVRISENLRLGTDFAPAVPDTHFAYTHEGGSFVDVGLRCVGIGKCRREEGGTMCPSYMVTREERHSTRGRARLLFEMLEADPVKGGWRDEHVKEALDLCLACKGCKSDCPANVDMATYKAEFYAHYYARRIRPRAAYAMGLIYWWARAGSKLPRAANAITHSPGVSKLMKKLGGIAAERDVPMLARESFSNWFRHRRTGTESGRTVVLWPDTFNNYFSPEVAQAAVEVLEGAGWSVQIPSSPLCCGRPLYDYGMLPTAKRLLRRILKTMATEIRAGVPFVGLEPSCTAVFRDELTNLFPHDEDAKRLSEQFFTLAELLTAEGYEPPAVGARVLVHGHCHHKAIMGMDADKALLEKTGAEIAAPDTGCCGLAGSFGYEAGEKYDISLKVGEHDLIPKVRAATPGTIVVTDGFSCRSQIEQMAGRRALHLAELLRLGLGPGAAKT